MPTPVQPTRVQVQVVAVAGGLNFQKELLVPAQQTLGWAVNASGLYALAPAWRDAALGVWGKLLPATTLVAAGDRIEVYQPATPQALQAHRQRLRARAQSRKGTTDANPA